METTDGGRVTRTTLRKRITSIDSDKSSSRPGTPVQTKLTTTASSKMSTDSPLKARMTRRNSTSGVATPVKTPAKRTGTIASIAENEGKAESPARRTRRRSMSTSVEVDGPIQPLNVKVPNFSTLSEEQETNRITRSKSKSPQQVKSAKTTETKPTRKSLRNAKADNETVVKVEEKKDSSKKKSPQKKEVPTPHRKVPPKDTNDEEHKENMEPSMAKTTNTPQKKLSNVAMAKGDKVIEILEKKVEAKGEENMEVTNKEKTPEKLEDVNDISEKEPENAESTTKETVLTSDEVNNEISSQSKVNKEKSPQSKEVNEEKSPQLKEVNEEKSPQSVEVNKDKSPVDKEKSAKEINVENSPHTEDVDKETSLRTEEVNEENLPLSQSTSEEKTEESETLSKEKSPQAEPMSSLNVSSSVMISSDNNEPHPGLKNDQPTNENIATATQSKAEVNKGDENIVTNMKPEVLDNEDEPSNAGDISMAVVEEEDIESDIVVKNEVPDDVSETNKSKSPSNLSPTSEELCMHNDEPMDASTTNENEEICKTPSPIKQKSTSFKVQIATPIQSSIKGKAVAFNGHVSDDEYEKSIYPKTPGSAKSKSFIELDSSFQGDADDSVVSVDDGSDMEIPETQQVEHNENEDKRDFINSKEKGDVEIIESTIEDNNSTKKNPSKSKEQNVEEDTTESLNKSKTQVHKDENVQNELKWCKPSVTGNTKLDTIAKQEDKKSEKNDIPAEVQEKSKKKKQRFLKRTEWKSDDEETLDDDEELDSEEDVEEIASGDEEEPEKPYRRKHAYHDDEAMVVDGYESGDSMDSEERREILENEIPVDGESIGSHTTDEEHCDEEESDDSFIVSDNDEDEGEEDHLEEESNTDSDDEEEEFQDTENKKREKKKPYKRIQRLNESSSSEDEQECEKEKSITDKNVNHNESNDHEEIKSKEIDTTEKNALNNSKLSDSALRLQNDDEDASSSDHENDGNKSRKEILRKLNQSDRFNKSVRDLNPDVEASSEVEGLSAKENLDESGKQIENEESEEANNNAEFTQVNTSKKCVKENDDSNEENNEEEEHDENEVNESKTKDHSKRTNNRISADEEEGDDDEGDDGELNESKANNQSIIRTKLICSEEEEDVDGEDEEGEVDVVQQEEQEEEEDDEEMADVETDSDPEKENESRQHISKPKHNRALSVSFGNFKSQKRDSLQKRVLQRSFTIGVRISGGEVGTAVIENKTVDESSNASTNPSSSSSSANDDTDEAVLSTEDVRYLENIKHMPLGNPLVRTRRQSLALPTNPDMEICTSSPLGSVPTKKPKRKSLALLSGNEFNPSQSFVHSLELRKAEFDRQTSKRKRLSKSFGGTSEGLDTSIIDLDARHMHKRSKLAIDSSFVDSLENLSSNKPMCSKVKHSSTPHEKVSKKSDTSIRRILNRCDEILEAANRAKLEAKINYKKSKVKLPKRNKKKSVQRQSSSPESKHTRLFAPLSKEFKRKEKLKRAAAVTRALKASADIIIGKTRKPAKENEENEENVGDSKRLPANFLESLVEAENQKAKTRTKKNTLGDSAGFRNYATSAGIVVETLRTPEKKKKPKVIQLATGKVCVEPITPTQRSIHSCQGMEFHESPATPYGFSIKFSALDTPQFPNAKDRKRKRNSATEENKKKTFPKPQWTQSGLFVEEEIPSARSSSQLSRILKKQIQPSNSNGNFKQNAILRADVKRSSAREILQMRERRPLQTNY